MAPLRFLPFHAVRSMDELLAIAAAMEQAAISGYLALGERMRREDQPVLAAVFDRLVAEERTHLEHVRHWSTAVTGGAPGPATLTQDELAASFDDEGFSVLAPQLLGAYRAFVMAIHNEEQAFVFWTHVASEAPSEEIRLAAEEMAREELGHIATLRRERRRAFHAERAVAEPERPTWSLVGLERRLADLLDTAAAAAADPEAADLRRLSGEASRRAETVSGAGLGDAEPMRRAAPTAADRAAPLCELLLDCYLDLAERLPAEEQRALAQELAGSAVHSLAAIRRLPILQPERSPQLQVP